MKAARVDVADRHTQLLQCCADLARGVAAFLVQLPLRTHVVELEGKDVLLAIVGSAMSKYYHVAAIFQRRNQCIQFGSLRSRQANKQNSDEQKEQSGAAQI